MPGNFFDTNVLVYLAAGDGQKAERAKTILRVGGTISVQVLNELTTVARRKLLMSWDHTHLLLAAVRKATVVVPLTVEAMRRGFGWPRVTASRSMTL